MLYLKAQTIETLADVQAALGNAIQLELSTIPPYLTALYSINPSNTTNTEIAALIRSIAIEEMLHMAIACNVLNAVGGSPAINVAGFPPTYPGQLPMDIGTQPDGPPFIVSLQAFSIDAVTGTFMVIEEPEDPIVFKTAAARAAVVPDFQTIGEFYSAVSTAIGNLGPSIFTGNPALQVTGWFDSDELFPVTTVATAQQAIAIIMQQGEGTTTSPLDALGELAHYYKFAEIAKGFQLVPDTSAPNGYSYTGPPIPFDPTGVFPMVTNPGQVLLPAGSMVLQMADQFDATYSSLLNALNGTFTGAPENLNVAMGLMYSLRVQAQDLMQQPIGGGTTGNAGPRWLFSEATAQG
jgi:Ferritin-like